MLEVVFELVGKLFVKKFEHVTQVDDSFEVHEEELDKVVPVHFISYLLLKVFKDFDLLLVQVLISGWVMVAELHEDALDALNLGLFFVLGDGVIVYWVGCFLLVGDCCFFHLVELLLFLNFLLGFL